MRLLPKHQRQGWLPYLLLPYLIFFFIEPIANHYNWRQWLFTIIGCFAFLASYFAVYWTKGRKPLVMACVIALLGFIYTPFNGGAICFFIYAASFFGFVVDAVPALALLFTLVVGICVESWLVHLPLSLEMFALGLSAMTGAININVRQRIRASCELRMARDEIENLAKIAERERIARDLHDVLGHTLSVIILKSELASKLIDRDVERVRSEILDVEHTSRQALAEVRQAIGGYRVDGLQAEIEKARAVLQTAGVTVDCDTGKLQMTAAQESVLALAIREATTNIVRHANAATCRLQLRQQDGLCRLEIQDDGCGSGREEGNGLRGMRERVEALGGSLQREIVNGTKLTVALPLSKAVGAEPL